MPESQPAVIVTGSAGMLGAPVCKELAERGYRVFAFDLVEMPEPLQNHPHIQSLEFDITDDEAVHRVLERVRGEAGDRLASVVHLAAYYDFSGEDSPKYEQITIDGTDRLLGALGAFHLEQFVFSSTMLVHAPCEIGGHIREDDPLEAKWPYPESKIRTEDVIRKGHPDIRSVILRLAGVYTDWGSQPTLAQQIKRIYERDLQSHVFPGNRDAGQSCVYLDDAVDSIVRTVERRGQLPAKVPILIGEPDPPGYGDLQERIGELVHGDAWSTVRVPKTVAKIGAAVIDTASGGEAFIKPFMIGMADDHYALDVSRAAELLDWRPAHRLLDQLPTIIENLKRNPQQWYQRNKLGAPPSS